jgi:hypothetical protein
MQYRAGCADEWLPPLPTAKWEFLSEDEKMNGVITAPTMNIIGGRRLFEKEMVLSEPSARSLAANQQELMLRGQIEAAMPIIKDLETQTF